MLAGMAQAADADEAADAEAADTIVLTEEEIRAMQALKMADVLNHVPGVKAGDASVSIHGSYKVKVFVDGRPISDPTSSHGGVNWDLVAPDDVVRIEILRGKGGLTYGQDASGGVILITTRQTRRLTGNLKAYGGNFDTRNLSAALATTLDKLSLGASGGYEATNGYKTNNDKERYQAGLKLGLDPGPRQTYSLSVDTLYDERGLSGLPAYPTPRSRKETRNTTYALQAEVAGVTSQTHYNDGRRHNTDPSRDLDKRLWVAKFNQEVATSLSTLAKKDLACGTGFTWDRADGTGFDPQAEQAGYLFAAQSLAWPAAHLSATAGLRATLHSDFDDVLGPEVKLVYKRASWRLTADYSRSHNTPSFYQRYNETSSTRPNPDLAMEQADNFSLGLFATLNKGVSFSLSGFYNLLTDRITYVTGDDGVGQYQNFGEVSYAGGDAALGATLHPSLKAKAAYTYLEAKDRESGRWLPGKSQHRAHLTLYWQPAQPLSVVATGRYVDSVYRNKANTESVPAYTLYDLRLEYALSRLALFSEIKNLANTRYYYADGLLAPPRTWVVGLNWRI
jgi:iron complex outermembrane receptor protein